MQLDCVCRWRFSGCLILVFGRFFLFAAYVFFGVNFKFFTLTGVGWFGVYPVGKFKNNTGVGSNVGIIRVLSRNTVFALLYRLVKR